MTDWTETELSALRRAYASGTTRVSYDGKSVDYGSAEDLLVLKAFADRPKDWVDVDGVIIRQAGKLDWRYVFAHLAPLAELKEAPEIVTRLERRRQELDG